MPIPIERQPAWVLTEIGLLSEQVDATASRAMMELTYARGEEVSREQERSLLVMRQWPDLAAARAEYVRLLEQAAAWQLRHLADPGQKYLPYAPTGLTGLVSVADSSASVQLLWDVMPGATGYRVYRSPDGGGTWDDHADVTANALQIDHLALDSEFVFGVASVGTGGESGKAAVTVRTPAPPPPEPPAPQPTEPEPTGE